MRTCPLTSQDLPPIWQWSQTIHCSELTSRTLDLYQSPVWLHFPFSALQPRRYTNLLHCTDRLVHGTKHNLGKNSSMFVGVTSWIINSLPAVLRTWMSTNAYLMSSLAQMAKQCKVYALQLQVCASYYLFCRKPVISLLVVSALGHSQHSGSNVWHCSTTQIWKPVDTILSATPLQECKHWSFRPWLHGPVFLRCWWGSWLQCCWAGSTWEWPFHCWWPQHLLPMLIGESFGPRLPMSAPKEGTEVCMFCGSEFVTGPKMHYGSVSLYPQH